MQTCQAQSIIEQFILQVINSDRVSNPPKRKPVGLLGFKQPLMMFLSPTDSESPNSVVVEMATPKSYFSELGLSFTFPLEICDKLQEEMGMPEIPNYYRRMIPSTFDAQDPPLKPLNKFAKDGLTVSEFATKLARWLVRNHPNVHISVYPLHPS